MRSRSRRIVMTVGLVLGGAYLAAGSGTTGCVSFSMGSAFAAADFCFIFDCQNGLFGGTLQPCSNDNRVGANESDILTDCP